MPRPYFEKTPLDKAFYEEHLKPRLPARIFDVHAHLNLPEHLYEVPEERWRSDWALESGHLLPVEDAYARARELFPDARYAIAGMPWPIREADLAANNRYLADERAQGLLNPFLAVRPEWDSEQVERELREIRQRYPRVAVIVAHLGRSGNLRAGLRSPARGAHPVRHRHAHPVLTRPQDPDRAGVPQPVPGALLLERAARAASAPSRGTSCSGPTPAGR